MSLATGKTTFAKPIPAEMFNEFTQCNYTIKSILESPIMSTSKKSNGTSNATFATVKKSATKKPAKQRDAIALLKADHAEVKAMHKHFEELVDRKASAGKRKTLAEEICKALKAHADAEEQIFYPAMRKVLKKSDLNIVNHADVEHASAKALLEQIQSMEATDPHFDAKVCVLCEYVAHHVKEEEGEMFPKAKSSKLDLVELGQQIEEHKRASVGLS